eukprot:m51a1_g10109 hypothetical protein (1363) ;mRNA; r:4181-12560
MMTRGKPSTTARDKSSVFSSSTALHTAKDRDDRPQSVISLQRAVPVAVGAVTAAVILLSIAPIASLWVVTTSDLSDTAAQSIEEQVLAFRTVIIARAVANISVQLSQPETLAGILRHEVPSQVLNGSTYQYTAKLRSLLLPLRVNFPIFLSINLAYTNARGAHMFTEVAEVGSFPEYSFSDSEVSLNYTFYKYINLTVPTSEVSRTIENYNVTARSWWIRGVYHNSGGVAWTGPFRAASAMDGMLLSYTQLIPCPDRRYHCMAMFTFSVRWLEEYFAKTKHTAHGWSMLVNDQHQMVTASPGIVTTDSAGDPIPVANSPNASVRDIMASWMSQCSNVMCEAHFVFDSDTFVDAAIVARNGDLSWWIVLVTPKADFLGKMQQENDRARAKTKATVAIVVSVTVVVSLVAVALATLLGFRIVGPLAEVTQQMHQVSLMNLSALSGDAFQTPRRSSIKEVYHLEKEAMKMSYTLSAFSKYVPMTVVKNLVRNKLRPAVGVKEMRATALTGSNAQFLDVVNFTATMDLHGPNVVIEILEEMFDSMSTTLEDNGAIIDKYIGDSIMALWGCPEPVADSELKSCRAVWEMHCSLGTLNAKFQKVYGLEMSIRVGWHSGTVFAGNVGCSTRLNYTVLGNSVNLASRLESLNKELGTRYCVTDAIRDQCSDTYSFRCLGRATIRGFVAPVTVHEFLGETSQLSSAAQRTIDNYRDIDGRLCKGELTAAEEHVQRTAMGALLLDDLGQPLVSVRQRPSAGYLVSSISAAVVDSRGRRARKQFGPDDSTYEMYPRLRSLVPRCFATVQRESDGPAAEPVCILRGMPKFTGLDTGEEDEAQAGQSHRSTEHMCSRARMREATHAVVTHKANGKSVVVTCFRDSGRVLYVLGSKNTHVVADAGDARGLAAQVPEGMDLVAAMAAAIDAQAPQLRALGDVLEAHTLCGEYEDGNYCIDVSAIMKGLDAQAGLQYEEFRWPQSRLLVLTHGIPGDGKSTRAAHMARELNALGVRAVVVEQDSHGGDREATMAELQTHAFDPAVRVVLLARCNACPKQYASYRALAEAAGMSTLGAVPEGAATTQMALVAMHGVLTRDAAAHGTMCGADGESRAAHVAALLSFRAVFKTPRAPEDVDAVVHYRTFEHFDVAEEVANWLGWYQCDVAKAPFDRTKVKARDIAEVLQKTSMETEDYGRHRLPVEVACAPVLREIQRLLETLSPLPVTPKYIGVAVPQAARTALTEQCETAAQRAGLPLEGKWYLHHLTVAFKSPQPDELVCAQWSSALRLLGTRLTVECRYLVVSARSRGIAVRARLSDSEGADANAVVQSGVPHVTAHMPEGVKPALASQMIAEATPDEVVPLEAPVEWTGAVVGFLN